MLGMQGQMAGLMKMVSDVQSTLNAHILPDLRHQEERQHALESLNVDVVAACV